MTENLEEKTTDIDSSLNRLVMREPYTTKYKGYLIEVCVDGTYDVMRGFELIEFPFKTIDEAKAFIDTHSATKPTGAETR